MSTDRYTRLKNQRAEQRRLKQITELTARIGHLALEIYAIDEAAGRPVDTDVSAAVREAFRIMKQTHRTEEER
jgi:hypothetical protein